MLGTNLAIYKFLEYKTAYFNLKTLTILRATSGKRTHTVLYCQTNAYMGS